MFSNDELLSTIYSSGDGLKAAHQAFGSDSAPAAPIGKGKKGGKELCTT